MKSKPYPGMRAVGMQPNKDRPFGRGLRPNKKTAAAHLRMKRRGKRM